MDRENIQSEASAAWEINRSSHELDDKLLNCLMAVATHYDRQRSAQALTTGLPLVNNRLTPELVPRAAKRADLDCKIAREPLSEISNILLPAILLLENKNCCVLLEVNAGMASIIDGTTRTGISEVPVEELMKQYTGYAIFIKPAHTFSKRAEESIINKPKKNWFWSVFYESWPVYSEALVASFLINVFALAVPLFIMNVYDRVVPNHAIETLWVLAIGVIIVFSFDFVMKTLRGYFLDIAGKSIDVKLSATIFERIMNMKLEHKPRSVGSFASVVSSFEAFREFMASTTVAVLIDLPFVFIFLTVIAMLGGSLFWIPFIMVPLVIIVGLLLQMPLVEYTKMSFKHASEKQATLIESLSGAETLKTINAEGFMQNRWEQTVRLASKVGMKLRFYSNLGMNLTMLFQQLATVLVIIFGVYMISEGEMTTGALVACTILTGRALAPLGQVAGLLSRYYQSVNSLESLNNVMQMPTERDGKETPLHRPKLDGDIKFKNVDFNYPNQQMGALNDVTLHIRQGERVGIIGRIGSGKSTIARLIMQLYEPQSGSILIDDTQIQQIDHSDLRANIGYVPQDINLFYGTVKHNMTLGASYVDDEQVLRASILSGAHRFISQHPSGYELEVAEHGANLSGGQRQAIAISRSLLLEPNILIFDEPCNSMDDTSELTFRNNLLQYLDNTKTMILITHKASMLSLVNRLIVVEGGKILADGSREEVIKALSEGQIKIPKKNEVTNENKH